VVQNLFDRRADVFEDVDEARPSGHVTTVEEVVRERVTVAHAQEVRFLHQRRAARHLRVRPDDVEKHRHLAQARDSHDEARAVEPARSLIEQKHAAPLARPARPETRLLRARAALLVPFLQLSPVLLAQRILSATT